jgi:hypothetical protein
MERLRLAKTAILCPVQICEVRLSLWHFHKYRGLVRFGYMQAFFDGTPALGTASWFTPFVKMPWRKAAFTVVGPDVPSLFSLWTWILGLHHL